MIAWIKSYIVLRTAADESLLDAMSMLDRASSTGGVSTVNIDKAKLRLARELVRRKIVFW